MASLCNAFYSGLWCGLQIGAALFGIVDWFKFTGLENRIRWDYVLFNSVLTLTWVVVGDADRQWRLVADEQRRQLRDGYSGSVRDAQCSVPQDKARIFEEI